MTQLEPIYRCPICGNMVSVVHTGVGELVCCGKPMGLLEEKTNEEGLIEKHVPVIEKNDQSIRVQVGTVLHPMEPAHYIEWIELIVDNCSYLQFLQPNQAPVAEFRATGKDIAVRIYCNIHGLWKNI